MHKKIRITLTKLEFVRKVICLFTKIMLYKYKSKGVYLLVSYDPPISNFKENNSNGWAAKIRKIILIYLTTNCCSLNLSDDFWRLKRVSWHMLAYSSSYCVYLTYFGSIAQLPKWKPSKVLSIKSIVKQINLEAWKSF